MSKVSVRKTSELGLDQSQHASMVTNSDHSVAPTPVTIRQSTVKNMELCAAMEKYRDQEGWLEYPGEAAAWGTVKHTVIADELRGELNLDADYIETLLTEEVGEYPQLLDGFNMAKFVQEQREAHLAWQVRYLPIPNIISIEQTYELDLGEGILLQGTPDLLQLKKTDGHDWKSSGRQWYQSEADHSVQPGTYILLGAGNGLDMSGDFAFHVYNRPKKVWEDFETHRTAAQLSALRDNIIVYGKMLQARLLPATPVVVTFGKYSRRWICDPKYCPAWNICTDKQIIQDEKLSKVRTVTWDNV